MSTDPVPDSLVAAVLSDLVYHNGNESIIPPPGWEEVGSYYDPSTGYYGEAWAKLTLDANGNAISGSYTEVIQVNRGTVFTATGSGAPTDVAAFTDQDGIYVPGANLSGENAVTDRGNTISADVQIVLGQKPDYVVSADVFYQQIRNITLNGTRPFASIPIIETGQSLGGATADSVVADNYQSSGGNLSAITFNALPFGRGIDNLTSAAADTLPVINYYVGNEQLTQGAIGSVFQWITGGPQIGTAIQLPALPSTISIFNAVTIHDPASAIAELYSYLYPNSQTEAGSSGLTWLQQRYPTLSATPAQIKALFTASAIPPDQPVQDIIANLNDTVSIVSGGDGSLAAAQQIETVSQTQAASPDTYQVFSVVADASGGEQAVWETNTYNSSGQLVGVAQSKTYTDGSFAIYNYNPRRVLQSIYTDAADGDILEQTYSNGELNKTITLKPNNTLEIQQYKDDPVLISDATFDLGTGTVTEILDDSDQSVLTEVDYNNTPSNNGEYLGIVANADGTTDLVEGQGEAGADGQIIDFGSGGLSDDTIKFAVIASGAIALTMDIASGAVTDIASDQNLANVQDDFAFTGDNEVLQLNTPANISGIISNLVPGDVIDLANIGLAASATLDAGNVLTVQDGINTYTLNLDPNQSFAGYQFSVASDGDGGTNIELKDLPGIYVVQPGDTLASIASQYNLSTQTLETINAPFADSALANGGSLTAGGILHVPISSIFPSAYAFSSNDLSNSEAYVFDPTSGAEYVVGSSLDGHDSGALVIDTPVAGDFATFDKGTYTGISASNNGTVSIVLATPTGASLGTLALNGSTGAGTLTLTDGLPIAISGGSAFYLTSPDQTENPEQVLLGYLAQLGDPLTAQQFDAAEDNWLFSSIPSDPVPYYGNLGSDVFYDILDDRGSTQIYDAGQKKIILINEGDADVVVTGQSAPNTTNVLIADGDISQVSLSNIPILYIGGQYGWTNDSVGLTLDQFNSFSVIFGSNSNIITTTTGTFDLAEHDYASDPGLFYDGQAVEADSINLSAGDFGGTTLIGDDNPNQTLTASSLGNDILIAGNGTGDKLVAGNGDDMLTGGSAGNTFLIGGGVDTVTGGTGNDTFILEDTPSSGTTITGGGGSDTLEAETYGPFNPVPFGIIDISDLIVSNIQTLDSDGIEMKIAQFGDFSSIVGSVDISDSAMNIEDGLTTLMAYANNIAEIIPTDTSIEISASTYLADFVIANKVQGGVLVSDTAADIANSLVALAPYETNITTLTPTEAPVIISAATFLSLLSSNDGSALLDKIIGGYAVSDTAANIESALATLSASTLNVYSNIL